MEGYQENLENIVQHVSQRFPGNDVFTSQISTLITTYPPTFIHVHDPATTRITSALLKTIMGMLSSFDPTDFPPEAPQVVVAHVDAVACFAPRLLYDSALNQLAKWRPTWGDGCENWSDGGGLRFNDSLDGFMHGLRALRTHLRGAREALPAANGRAKGKGKAKAKAKAPAQAEIRMVLVVERAERLKESMPEHLVPLTRLAELSQVDITTVFLSHLPWEDYKPPLGAALDPYRMSVPPPSKQATLDRLAATFSACAAAAPSEPTAYHPALAPLYAVFLSTLYSVCAPFTVDPDALAYLAAARWPGFAHPVLDAHARHPDTPLAPPPEDARMRLVRFFTPSFTAALEALLPRLASAAAWARAHAPEIGAAALEPGRSAPPSPRKPGHVERRERGGGGGGGGDEAEEAAADAARALPVVARFVLVAAYLASTNPPKSDVRMFGRAVEARRKKKGGGTRKTAARAGNAKKQVPQRLLGPLSFPLDRLLAVLGFLLEEYDLDARVVPPEMALIGEYTEMELGRVHVYGTIVELASMHLLQRTSPPERLDGPPTFKCGVSYELALALARELRVPLLDLLYDAN
ncbi:origin recognition complex subunit 5 C-terminus-domain-containing protein [Amylostereum chailletii]|nr:origin recognition complex subunit 5 C-terminus-domain-containing protein [Amylostereum chailletii]